MNSQLKTISRFLKEFPRYSRTAQDAAAVGLYLRSFTRNDLSSRLEGLSRAYSLAQSRLVIALLCRSLQKYLPEGSKFKAQATGSVWQTHQIGWHFYSERLEQSPAASRTIILKEPGENGEKGVILSCFEYNWLRLLKGIDPFSEFDQKYTLILSTSWSPTNYNILGLALEKISGDVYVVPCNHAEIPKLEAFHPRIRPLPFLACDWLEPSYFSPRPWNERTWDIVMVSNWAPFKRHWHVFRILRDLPAELRIVCIGQPEAGYTLKDIRRLKEEYGVRQDIEFLESLPIEKVNEIQSDSKIALIFSRREGCCVAAVEGLMADAYLVMLKGAHVGPLDYIRKNTGAAVTDANAAIEIRRILESGEPPESREWTSREISCHATIRKLNKVLKEDAAKQATPWTDDLATPCWRPFPRFVDESDRAKLIDEAHELSQKYPAIFPGDWLDKSHL